ncbi:hypothetical protein NDU88_003290 [Pleurodeles waltl]|uniref:Uncharacterized protein n=1 Tax=Pleurodeles waltl TaxID=8319 RepID=A0AAV7WRZ1_PLEWA|nr:hypothetical protein NDU88_003290 [Pleurodeles waltl]
MLHVKTCKICNLCSASLRYLESLCCQVDNAHPEFALARIDASPLPRRRHSSVNTHQLDDRIDASPLPRRRRASGNTHNRSINGCQYGNKGSGPPPQRIQAQLTPGEFQHQGR